MRNCSRILTAGGGGGAGITNSGGPGGVISLVEWPAESGKDGGGGGGGYVSGSADTGFRYYYHHKDLVDGGTGGTSYSKGKIVKFGVGTNKENLVGTNPIPSKLPFSYEPCYFTTDCYFVPLTRQPTGMYSLQLYFGI